MLSDTGGWPVCQRWRGTPAAGGAAVTPGPAPKIRACRERCCGRRGENGRAEPCPSLPCLIVLWRKVNTLPGANIQLCWTLSHIETVAAGVILASPAQHNFLRLSLRSRQAAQACVAPGVAAAHRQAHRSPAGGAPAHAPPARAPARAPARHRQLAASRHPRGA